MPKFAANSNCESYEIKEPGSDGTFDDPRWPFSEAVASGGDLTDTLFTKVWMVEHHGWPEARRFLKDKKGRPLIDAADDDTSDPIWILKAKPSCWRLYFYVDQTSPPTTRFVYLHAVCKKEDKRDPAQSRKARTILNRARDRRAKLSRFPFPSR